MVISVAGIGDPGSSYLSLAGSATYFGNNTGIYIIFCHHTHFLNGLYLRVIVKKTSEKVVSDGCLRFSIRRMLPTFSAQDPYYFMRYYIVFTMLGPGILYVILKISKCKKIKCIAFFSFAAIMFTVGYSLLGKVKCLGGSYLGVYVLGMIMGYGDYSFRHKRRWCILGIVTLTVGFYYTWIFYMNAINGVIEPVGINRIFPRLRMNPPNMSICIYSMGVIILAYFLFDTLNNKYSRGMIYIGLQFWKILGKYSLDIFLWHILIQNVLEQQTSFDNVYIKSVVYYIFMLFLPVCGRKLWTMAKKDFYSVCQEEA